MSKKVASIFDNKSEDDDSEHQHQQAFFAGGSEHSGQQILGPSRANNPLESIDELLNHARQHSETNPSPSNDTVPVIFYRNGFTIGEDSELRDYESNREFLTHLRQGQVPPELAAQVRGAQIDVKLENRAFKDYEPPKNNRRPAFKGEGFRLGVPTPSVVGEGQSSSSSTADQASESSGPSLDEIRRARLARFGSKPKEQEK